MRGCASDRVHGFAFTCSRHSLFVVSERKVVLAGQVKAASPLPPPGPAGAVGCPGASSVGIMNTFTLAERAGLYPKMVASDGRDRMAGTGKLALRVKFLGMCL